MPYPESSDVSAGQPTASAHYNNLRKDALYLGKTGAEVTTLGNFFAHYIHNLRLEYLATNRIRVPYDADAPARIMLNGYMLQQSAAIDSAAGLLSGAAATWYIFAEIAPGSTTFTITINSSPVPSATQRLIGQCYWDGSAIVSTTVYTYDQPHLATPDYDSGWFAVTYNTVYTLYHYFGVYPSHFILLYSPAADGSTRNSWVPLVMHGTTVEAPITVFTDRFIVNTGNSATQGCLLSVYNDSGSGYYRLLAWR